MSEISYSSAEAKYVNEEGNKITIVLLDYNAVYNMYSMATAIWSSGFKIDTSEEFGQSINLGENINGWESYKKKRNSASMVLGLGDRFLLTMEGNNQNDCDFLKDVAKSMALDELVALD